MKDQTQLHPSKATGIQWMLDSATYYTTERGTNEILVSPVSACPTTAPINDQITITLSDDTIATVTYSYCQEDGILVYDVEALLAGTTTVTATLGDLEPAVFTIEVQDRPEVEDIAFPDEMPTKMAPQSSTTWLDMVVTPEDGDISELTIESSEPTMIDVQQYPGNKARFKLTCTPLATVSTEVTITAIIGEEAVKTATITIAAPAATSIAFAAPGWNMMTTDEPVETTITILPNGASAEGLTVASGDDTIATVEQDASDPTAITITAVADGETTLTATLGTLTATAGVAVGSLNMQSGYLSANP